MRFLTLFVVAFGLFVAASPAQTGKKQDSTKRKTTIVGQDSISRHNAERQDQRNRKREHKKNIYDKQNKDKK